MNILRSTNEQNFTEIQRINGQLSKALEVNKIKRKENTYNYFLLILRQLNKQLI